jgi:hypothetical protein
MGMLSSALRSGASLAVCVAGVGVALVVALAPLLILGFHETWWLMPLAVLWMFFVFGFAIDLLHTLANG